MQDLAKDNGFWFVFNMKESIPRILLLAILPSILLYNLSSSLLRVIVNHFASQMKFNKKSQYNPVSKN